MKKALFLFFTAALTVTSLYPQHLPHKENNQWHYDRSSIPGLPNYAAVAIERVLITGTYYWQIDRFNAETGELIETVYDRTEGDSLYIRKVACPEELIINFDWPLGFIEVTAIGNDCYKLRKLISKYSRDVFGITTMSYKFETGLFCEGYADTVWDPFMPEITKELGCFWANDGKLVGAVINGVTYGTLYPLPVELISFSAVQTDNKSVLINWKTASETNNSGFQILKKKYESNEQWGNVAFVEGQGTTTEIQEYSYADNQLQKGSWLYRIIQYDYDGTHKLIGETPVDILMTPDVLTLEQNFPNPFNPLTTIKYTLASESFVSLSFYDAVGNEIARPINQETEAGVHTYEFNASGLASGMYFYKLTAGDKSIVRKMLLMK